MKYWIVSNPYTEISQLNILPSLHIKSLHFIEGIPIH